MTEEKEIHRVFWLDCDGEWDFIDITLMNPKWEHDGIFNYVTKNLLSKGYLENGDLIYIDYLIDLLNQARDIILRQSNNLKYFDYVYKDEITLPDGTKTQIIIEWNAPHKFAIMLPEDQQNMESTFGRGSRKRQI